ncbi:unnamed protein product [Clonostachys rosea]|uniref:G-protein coupled receptors family 1 profile domain-containing protein n=1 Tax=Bionectria ochroleuca TaxID=29856 RepID=A0ABY6UZA3_BIOOC|nr:unnamed protein product [Clonostachys rosea]
MQEIFVAALPGEPEATGDPLLHTVRSIDSSSLCYGLGATLLAFFAFLGTASLLIRFAACIFCRKGKVLAQDVVGLLASVPFCVMLWCGYEQLNAGVLLTRQSDIGRDALARLFFLSFIASMMFYTMCILAKSAILFDWARGLFYRGASPAASRTCYILIVLIPSYFPSIITFLCVRRRPTNEIWVPWIPVSRTSSAPVAFTTVGVGCAVGQVQAMHRDRNLRADNRSNIISEIYLWELAEYVIVLIIFCLPTVQVLVQALVDSIMHRRRRNQIKALGNVVNIILDPEAIPMERLRAANATRNTDGSPLEPTEDKMDSWFGKTLSVIQE